MDLLRDLAYYQPREFSTSVAGCKLRVVTKPGLPQWDEITPATRLLADTVILPKVGQVLLLGCSNGALGVMLCNQRGGEDLKLVDTNAIALRVAQLTLAANGCADVPVDPLSYPLPEAFYTTVVIDLPKGRRLARRWLVEAWEALQPGGELYLAGANAEGIQSVIQDAGSLFGNRTVLAYQKGCRVARMVKFPLKGQLPDQSLTVSEYSQVIPWSTEPGIARGSWIEFSTSICGETFSIHSLPGVFSADHIDQGTLLLLQHLSRDQVKGKRVLDFGCGYGLIGMMAARFGAAWVDLLDVDLSAVAAAQENCLRNGILNTLVHPSDVLEAVDSERYDLILSNPPFHAGNQVEYDISRAFITHAYHILEPGGRCRLVANRFIRYDRLMKEIFGNVERLAETGKYHLLESVW
jgi:16S rRNA (guanine1207-N2)-methyltransferase